MDARLAGLNLTHRQMEGVRHVQEHGRITRKEYETVAEVPTATAKRDLSELVKGKVLVQQGKGRSISYVLSAQIVSRNVSRNVSRKTGEK